MARQLINAFNSGEFTDELLGRVDLESLRKACRLCRNFLPRTLGGVSSAGLDQLFIDASTL